jgi:hypothetical protein
MLGSDRRQMRSLAYVAQIRKCCIVRHAYAQKITNVINCATREILPVSIISISPSPKQNEAKEDRKTYILFVLMTPKRALPMGASYMCCTSRCTYCSCWLCLVVCRLFLPLL